MIEVRGLSKSFGNKTALRDVSFSLAEGEFLTIFGPNGAGKTTLIRILAALSKPSSGTVRLAGLDLRDGAAALRRRIGVVSHQTFLYGDLTVEENLKFYGKMYDVSHLERRVREVIERVGLAHRLHDPVRTLSRGMQQRLSIARALIHDPAIMLLDEPYTGLDQHAAEMLREVLASLAAEKRTVIMTTHNLERGLQLCGHVAILVAGRIAYQEKKASVDVGRFREVYYRYVGAQH
ncbi:MAG: heme ABC exporter ATP-binding protein CcmA [Dehalococcoidia bacterium]